MCFSAAASSENDQGNMNLASNTALRLDDPVQRRSHPADYRVADPALDISDDLPGRALVPLPIEVLSREPQLDEQIARMVLRLQLRLVFLARGAAGRARRSP